MRYKIFAMEYDVHRLFTEAFGRIQLITLQTTLPKNVQLGAKLQ